MERHSSWSLPRVEVAYISQKAVVCLLNLYFIVFFSTGTIFLFKDAVDDIMSSVSLRSTTVLNAQYF